MEPMKPGEYIPFETRAEANEKVDKQRRYMQILKTLGDKEMTAKEIAVQMCNKGYIPTTERNFTAPRLSELQDRAVVEVIGKKRCSYTGKTVSIYKRRDRQEDNIHD